jgi:hypothetical protein
MFLISKSCPWSSVRFMRNSAACAMAKRRRIGEFPQNVIGEQRLPSRIVVNQRLDVLLQEVRSDCHLIVLVVEQAALHDTSCGASGRSAGEVRFGFANVASIRRWH